MMTGRSDQHVKQDDAAKKHQAIQELAYKKWENAGRPMGNDGTMFWLDAEQEYYRGDVPNTPEPGAYVVPSFPRTVAAKSSNYKKR